MGHRRATEAGATASFFGAVKERLGREQIPGLGELLPVAGTEQTVVTNFAEAWWEHVLQEAADELLGVEGAVLKLVSGRLLVGESNLTICQLAQSVVAEGDAKDVRGEILKGGLAGTDGLAINHPALFPDTPVDGGEEAELFEGVTRLGAEDEGERLLGHQRPASVRPPPVTM